MAVSTDYLVRLVIAELFLEEGRRSRLVHVGLPCQFVVVDGFQIQTSAVGVLVVFRQRRYELCATISALGASFGAFVGFL
jgi:hypothetical protein